MQTRLSCLTWQNQYLLVPKGKALQSESNHMIACMLTATTASNTLQNMHGLQTKNLLTGRCECAESLQQCGNMLPDQSIKNLMQ